MPHPSAGSAATFPAAGEKNEQANGKKPKYHQRPSTMQTLNESTPSRVSRLPPNSLASLGVQAARKPPGTSDSQRAPPPEPDVDELEAKDSDDSGLGGDARDVGAPAETKPSASRRVGKPVAKPARIPPVEADGRKKNDAKPKKKNKRRDDVVAEQEPAPTPEVAKPTRKDAKPTTYPKISRNTRGRIVSTQSTEEGAAQPAESSPSRSQTGSERLQTSSVADDIERMQQYRERQEKLQHPQPQQPYQPVTAKIKNKKLNPIEKRDNEPLLDTSQRLRSINVGPELKPITDANIGNSQEIRKSAVKRAILSETITLSRSLLEDATTSCDSGADIG